MLRVPRPAPSPAVLEAVSSVSVTPPARSVCPCSRARGSTPLLTEKTPCANAPVAIVMTPNAHHAESAYRYFDIRVFPWVLSSIDSNCSRTIVPAIGYDNRTAARVPRRKTARSQARASRRSRRSADGTLLPLSGYRIIAISLPYGGRHYKALNRKRKCPDGPPPDCVIAARHECPVCHKDSLSNRKGA